MRLLGERTRDEEFAREMEFHLGELAKAHQARGLSPDEARRQAVLDFGGPTQVQQAVREVHLHPFADAVWLHLRAAIRFLRHAPLFSLVVIATLALGIGANSAVFSVLDAVVLRPLPYPASHELVFLVQRDLRTRDGNRFVAPVRLEDWNRLATAFQAISGSYTDDLTEVSGSLPERLKVAFVAPRFLTVLGVAPLLGRDFLPTEEHFGGPDAVLISHRLWERRFNGDPHALGRLLHVGHGHMTIVGVMPSSFTYPDKSVDLWSVSPPDAPYAQDRSSTWFNVIGRLKPGVSVAQGLANLQAVQRHLGQEYGRPDADLQIEITPMKDAVVGDARPSLWLVYGAVCLLLLIACSNIAALLLARTTDREQEIAVRFSLGASRRTLVVQLLVEVLALAVLGSILGLLTAGGLLQVFHHAAANIPRMGEIALNWRIVAYSFACAAGTTVLCGLHPALRATRRQLAPGLASGTRTQTAARTPMQWILVGVQISLAVVLLTGASLLLRSLRELGHVDPGFDASHVLTFQVTGSYAETADWRALQQRVNRTLNALRALPGVEAASTTGFLPGIPIKYQMRYKVDGHDAEGQPLLADGRLVSDGYFATVHIPLLTGATCTQSPAAPEYVVNRSFAERYFGSRPVLGHMLAVANEQSVEASGRIVGMVADAREQGLNAAPVPTAYACASAGGPTPVFLVRTHGDPTAMAATVRQLLRGLEPGRSVYAVQTLEAQLRDAFSDDRLRTAVLSGFAASAVTMACLGLYGTLSYLARRREREIGLRLTLGASRGRVAGMLLGEGLRAALAGCAVGSVASVFCGRLLAGMLFGISPLDTVTYGTVLAITLAAAFLACALPAWRAALIALPSALRAA